MILEEEGEEEDETVDVWVGVPWVLWIVLWLFVALRRWVWVVEEEA